MTNISRREVLGGALAAGAGLLTLHNNVEAQAETLPLAFAGKHQPKPLPFDPTKLISISEKLIRSHHENNYKGAVKALNVVEKRIAELGTEIDLPAYNYSDIKHKYHILQ